MAAGMVSCSNGEQQQISGQGEYFVIEPGHEEDFVRSLELSSDVWLDTHPYAVDSIRIEEDAVTVTVTGSGLEPVTMVLHHPSTTCPGGLSAGQFRLCHDQKDQTSRRIAGLLAPGVAQLSEPVWTGITIQVQATEQADPSARNWFVFSIVNVLAFLALLLVAGGRGWLHSLRQERVLFGTLFAMALLVRLYHATWGVGDFFLNVWPVFQQSNFHTAEYGNTPNALFMLLLSLVPPSLNAIIWTLLICSSLAVPFFYLFLKEGGKSTVGAACGAIALMFMPLLIRYGGEANRQTLVLFFAVVALWSLARFHRTGSVLDALLLLLSAAACTACRPEAGIMLGMLGLYGLVGPVRSVRHRLLSWSVLFLVMGFGLLYWFGYLALSERVSRDGGVLEGLFSLRTFSPDYSLWMNTDATPVLFMVLAALGVVAGIMGRQRLVLWSSMCLLIQTLLVAQWHVAADGLNMVFARFQTLAFLFFAVLVGSGAKAVIDVVRKHLQTAFAPVVMALLVGATVGSVLPPISTVLYFTSADHEYRFIRQAMQKLPTDSIIYVVPTHLDFALNPPVFLSVALNRTDLEWRWFPNEWKESQRPAYFWMNSACRYAGHEGKHLQFKQNQTDAGVDCEFMKSALGQSVDEASIPFRPFMEIDSDYGELEVGLYRLDSAKASTIARRIGQLEM